jgi:hypothetical protein
MHACIHACNIQHTYIHIYIYTYIHVYKQEQAGLRSCARKERLRTSPPPRRRRLLRASCGQVVLRQLKRYADTYILLYYCILSVSACYDSLQARVALIAQELKAAEEAKEVAAAEEQVAEAQDKVATLSKKLSLSLPPFVCVCVCV